MVASQMKPMVISLTTPTAAIALMVPLILIQACHALSLKTRSSSDGCNLLLKGVGNLLGESTYAYLFRRLLTALKSLPQYLPFQGMNQESMQGSKKCRRRRSTLVHNQLNGLSIDSLQLLYPLAPAEFARISFGQVVEVFHQVRVFQICKIAAQVIGDCLCMS